MDYAEVSERVADDQLEIFGAFHPPDGGTILLLGPKEPGFWAAFKRTAEFIDGDPDPMDHWSLRVLESAAADLGARALFPFGGPPYHPFIGWAKATARAWDSPVGMLVHDRAGLFVSYRGALRFEPVFDIPHNGTSPCLSCATQPCSGACPVNALSPAGYDVATCHAFLETEAGEDCLKNGCKARRACPVSQSYGRLSEQSAHHMSYFHK